MKKRILYLGLALLAHSVAAAEIQDVPCTVIAALVNAMKTIVPSLLGIMFMYGAGKYIFSKGDPGAQKQGLNMCLHAVIGGIIFGLVASLDTLFGGELEFCSGVSF